MAEKEINLYYKKMLFQTDADYLTTFNKAILDFKSKKFDKRFELKEDGITYYVSGLKDETSRFPAEMVDGVSIKPYAVAITIAKVDTSEEFAFADLSLPIDERQQKVVLADGKPASDDKSTGPLIAANVLIDPFRGFFLSARSNNGITTGAISKLIGHLFGDVSIKFALVPDLQDIADLDKMITVNKLEYSVAYPTKLESFAMSGSTERQDIQFADEMESEEISISLKKPSKSKVRDRVKGLLSTQNRVKKLKIDGTSGSEELLIDLIHNKLTSKGTIQYDEGVVIPNEKYVDMLLFEYLKEYPHLKSLYDLSIPEEFINDVKSASTK